LYWKLRGGGGGKLATAGLFFDTPVSGAIADSRRICRMMDLLIEIVGWFAAFGLIAAIIDDTFR
jgi:hypothetical protein